MDFLSPTAVRFSSLKCLAWAKKEPLQNLLGSVPNLSLPVLYVKGQQRIAWEPICQACLRLVHLVHLTR